MLVTINSYQYLTYILKFEVTSCRSVITVVHKKYYTGYVKKVFMIKTLVDYSDDIANVAKPKFY